MPWDGSNRKARLPRDWDRRRRAVLDRDGHACQHVRADTGARCLAFASEVDHLDAMTDDHRLESLQALCSWHHGKKSGAEGGRAAARRREARGGRKHPGVL